MRFLHCNKFAQRGKMARGPARKKDLKRVRLSVIDANQSSNK